MNRAVTIAGLVLIAAGIASATDLTTYKATYEKEMDEITLAHGIKMTDLRQQYTKALDVLRETVKKAGDLDKTIAVMNDIDRFGKEKEMPAPPSALQDLQKLQSAFTKQASIFEADKAKKIILLSSKYDKVLERLQKSLVSASKLEDAKTVQAERKKIYEAEITKSAMSSVDQSKSESDKQVLPDGASKKEVGTSRLKPPTTSPKQWMSLADIEPAEAEVGHSELTRYGKGGDGLGIGGKKFDTAILAHASSSIIYNLDGQYAELSTSYGMKDGSGGSAVFHIIVDGKDEFTSDGMWSYGGTKTKGHKPISIRLSGAKTLELKTVGVRGGAGAWSAWGDPKIR